MWILLLFGQILNLLWQFYEGSIAIWTNFEPTLTNFCGFICYLAEFWTLNQFWTKFWQICSLLDKFQLFWAAWQSGHTAVSTEKPSLYLTSNLNWAKTTRTSRTVRTSRTTTLRMSRTTTLRTTRRVFSFNFLWRHFLRTFFFPFKKAISHLVSSQLFIWLMTSEIALNLHSFLPYFLRQVFIFENKPLAETRTSVTRLGD